MYSASISHSNIKHSMISKPKTDLDALKLPGNNSSPGDLLQESPRRSAGSFIIGVV